MSPVMFIVYCGISGNHAIAPPAPRDECGSLPILSLPAILGFAGVQTRRGRRGLQRWLFALLYQSGKLKARAGVVEQMIGVDHVPFAQRVATLSHLLPSFELLWTSGSAAPCRGWGEIRDRAMEDGPIKPRVSGAEIPAGQFKVRGRCKPGVFAQPYTCTIIAHLYARFPARLSGSMTVRLHQSRFDRS